MFQPMVNCRGRDQKRILIGSFQPILKHPIFSKVFIKRFLENKLQNGNILFVTSERGTFVDDLPYGLTKAALNSLVQGFDKGIRVNTVAPGITATDLVGLSESDNLYNSKQLNNRVYLAGEIAEVACFLVSETSNCMTGQIVCN